MGQFKYESAYFVGQRKAKEDFYRWIDNFVMLAFEYDFKQEANLNGVGFSMILRFLNEKAKNKTWKEADADFREDQLTLCFRRLLRSKKLITIGSGRNKGYIFYKKIEKQKKQHRGLRVEDYYNK
jgi:hypothetical protein